MNKFFAWFRIPWGFYCHDGNNVNKVCPYWFKAPHREEQENGYCAYLDKGDYEINKESRKMMIIDNENKITKEYNCSPSELADTEYWGFSKSSLLWDKCKECKVFLKSR